MARTRWRELAESDEAMELVSRYSVAQREARAADAALERLLELCRPVAGAIARRYAASEADAADMVQDALLYLALHLQELREAAAFPYWFARVAHSACRQWLRRERRHREARSLNHLPPAADALTHALAGVHDAGVPPEPPDPLAEDAAAALHTTDQIVRLLGLLPHREREAVRRVYLDDLTQLQAARRMDLSQKAVEGLLYRAIRRLRLVTRQCAEELADLTIWCTMCGRNPVRARLQPGDNARYPFRLRATCPGCAPRHPTGRWDWAYIGLPLDHYATLEHALVRGMSELAVDIQQLVQSPLCDACHQPMHTRHGDDLTGYLYWECRRCGISTSSDVHTVATAAPEWRAFWRSAPRMRYGETRVTRRDGERQLLVTAYDPTTGRAATAALAYSTLKVRSLEIPPTGR